MSSEDEDLPDVSNVDYYSGVHTMHKVTVASITNNQLHLHLVVALVT